MDTQCHPDDGDWEAAAAAEEAAFLAELDATSPSDFCSADLPASFVETVRSLLTFEAAQREELADQEGIARTEVEELAFIALLADDAEEEHHDRPSVRSGVAVKTSHEDESAASAVADELEYTDNDSDDAVPLSQWLVVDDHDDDVLLDDDGAMGNQAGMGARNRGDSCGEAVNLDANVDGDDDDDDDVLPLHALTALVDDDSAAMLAPPPPPAHHSSSGSYEDEGAPPPPPPEGGDSHSDTSDDFPPPPPPPPDDTSLDRGSGDRTGSRGDSAALSGEGVEPVRRQQPRSMPAFSFLSFLAAPSVPDRWAPWLGEWQAYVGVLRMLRFVERADVVSIARVNSLLQSHGDVGDHPAVLEGLAVIVNDFTAASLTRPSRVGREGVSA